MVAGCRQRLPYWGIGLRLRVVAVVVALLGATLAHAAVNGMNATHGGDQFDTSLLRVDEAKHLSTSVPNVTVLTANGPRELYDLIDEKPTIVQLAYFTCGHTCPMTLHNLAHLDVDASSSDYQMIILSFDVNDTPETMQAVQSNLAQVPDNWVFGLLPAEDISSLTESVGFNFLFSERDQTFVHPAVLVFLSPEGEVMRYLYGIDPRREDVELALIESRNRTPAFNEIVDMVRLTCFQYDASKSRYVLHPTVIFGGAGFGLLGLVGLVTFAYKKDPEGGR